LLPDGGVDLLAQSEERPEKQGLTWSAARSSSTFRLLACGFSPIGASVHACVIHLVSILIDRGISAANAALASSALGVASALTLSGALGSLLMALGFDRAGSYRLPLGFFLLATITAAVLMTRLVQYRFRPF
jgi:hypothetical protein